MGDYIMIDISIESVGDGFIVHMTHVDDGDTLPLGEIKADTITIEQKDMDKYLVIEE
jgi:hypothetical protein